ncbi:H-type lectin domain-containing protein [Flavobacterium fluvii]|uniref:H-type lectin domain-containing protein n=1 Tax=Flavobacterium fluvii TaxID=468056 RepID=A0A1M5ICV1_9FLAO|nr:H-type lectin domain-containing protein [Flavobacterium fluvii]SHG26091.1 H-type lectin domain-containing protein [Flavobacterium fluvii]
MNKTTLLPFCLFMLLISVGTTAQVGIGTTTPRGALEINSNTNGFVAPQVALTSTTISAPVVNPQDGGLPLAGTLVYNTSTAGDVTPGYYFWNGTAWTRLITSSPSWSLTGNSGTSAATNFMGTTDNNPLVFKTNNTEWMRVTPTGELAIGNIDPRATLDVTGTIYANNIGKNAFVLNSAGTNFGFLSNPSQNVWTLGYGTVVTTLATPVLSWTAGGKVGLGTATPTALLHLKDGHIKSEQTLVPTLTDITGLSVLGSASITSNSTDTKGLIDVTGTSIGTASVKVNFNISYTSAPIVMLTLANAAAQDYIVWVDAVTTTSFNINFKTSGSTVDPRFSYFVIE